MSIQKHIEEDVYTIIFNGLLKDESPNRLKNESIECWFVRVFGIGYPDSLKISWAKDQIKIVLRYLLINFEDLIIHTSNQHNFKEFFAVKIIVIFQEVLVELSYLSKDGDLSTV